VRSRFYGGVPASVGSFVRYVPDFADLVAIADPAVSSARPEELLPQGDRALHFIGSVRAQHVAAATVGAAAIAVRAVERPGSDGFRFTSSPAIANCGDTVELDWDDAGTALDAGFDAAHVRFKLCLEGCDVPSHYDVLLSDGQGSSLFANNGHATIAVPSLPRSSSSARILIENEGATFFNVTRADLEYRRCEQGVAQSPTPSINGNPAAAIAANGG